MGEIAVSQSTTCAKTECPEPGRFRPVVRVFTEKGPRVPGEAVLCDMLICGHHKHDATKVIMEDDECWAVVARMFAGRGKLDRTKTQVTYEEIE